MLNKSLLITATALLIFQTSFLNKCWAKSNSVKSRIQFSIPEGPSENLIQETHTLKLSYESSIQKLASPTHLYVSILGGITQPQHLNLAAHDHVVIYNFPNPAPLFTFQFSSFPLRTKYGAWGLAASLGYSYFENRNAGDVTALHLLPVQAGLSYRGQWKDSQVFIPYAMLSEEALIYFQRGTDQYRTSETKFFPVVGLGVSFKLNSLKFFESRNEKEVVLQYQRGIAPITADSNLNTNTFQIGGTLAL